MNIEAELIEKLRMLSKPQPQLNPKTTSTVVGFDTNMTLQPSTPTHHHPTTTTGTLP